MPRPIHRLTDRTVKAASSRGMYPDGGNLWLQVSAFGTKAWIFRYAVDGKTHDMGLGSARDVSLAEARRKAERWRKCLVDGDDPIHLRDAELAAKKAALAISMTFKECAEAYIMGHSAGWKSAKHASQWTNTLNAYAYPVLGELDVNTINVGLVMKVLEPIWTTKTETASRVRGRIEVILDWAAVRGYRSGDNPARLRGNLDKLLPARSRVQKVEHHRALPYSEIGDFTVALRTIGGVGARALEFTILTAVRTGEARGAVWEEVDFKEKVWTIPAARMKGGREHRVPLSAAALRILEEMKPAGTEGFIFPGQKEGQSISDMTMVQVLKRMKLYDRAVPHGFRSTFRDWAAEQTAFPREVAEMALAHAIGDRVEAAYRRGDLFNKRRKLMEAWAKYCATPSKAMGEIVALRR